jgi:hypothetical protein
VYWIVQNLSELQFSIHFTEREDPRLTGPGQVKLSRRQLALRDETRPEKPPSALMPSGIVSSIKIRTSLKVTEVLALLQKGHGIEVVLEILRE